MEHKLARICWNTNQWRLPSGREGKSRKKESFEHEHGFGHEEWLFDTSKAVNGYHYAFVQAVGAVRELHKDRTFRLSLYSIDSGTRRRWWVGAIGKVSVVGVEESAAVYRRYERSGWLAEMRLQLSAVGVDPRMFDKFITPENFAVIKFKVQDLQLLDTPLEFFYGDPAVTSDYYNLKNYIQEPSLPALSNKFVFKPGFNLPTDKKQLAYDQHERNVNNFHNHVQTRLFEKLCEQYGSENVGAENNTGVGSRIDLVVRRGKKFALYEIKTGPSLQSCVREAIGQLLEYRHMIGHTHVSKLIVVSPHLPEKWTESYLSTLRSEHKIPVYYEHCSA